MTISLANAIHCSIPPDADTQSLKPDAEASIDKRHERLRVLPSAAPAPQPTAELFTSRLLEPSLGRSDLTSGLVEAPKVARTQWGR